MKVAIGESHSIADLPKHLIQCILLAATDHSDLLIHVSVCAQVCAEWYQVVRTSAAYGGGPWVALGTFDAADVKGQSERARVLKQISRWLRLAQELPPASARGSDWRGNLSFYRANIGEKGGKALGAALQAWPAPLVLTDICLSCNQLTVAGLAPIVAAMRRGFAGDGLEKLAVCDNTGLGDVGATLLASALPPGLRRLHISNIGCSDTGMVAIAAALPALSRLNELLCGGHPAVGRAGWTALGAALPQMSALTCLEIRDCGKGMDTGVAALAPELPGATVLQELFLGQSRVEGIGNAGARALAAVLPRCTALQSLELTNNSYGVAGLEALNAAAAQHGTVYVEHPVDIESSEED